MVTFDQIWYFIGRFFCKRLFEGHPFDIGGGFSEGTFSELDLFEVGPDGDAFVEESDEFFVELGGGGTFSSIDVSGGLCSGVSSIGT